MGSRELIPLSALVACTAFAFFIKLSLTLELFFNLISPPCPIEDGGVRKHPGGCPGTSQDQPTSPLPWAQDKASFDLGVL